MSDKNPIRRYETLSEAVSSKDPYAVYDYYIGHRECHIESRPRVSRDKLIEAYFKNDATESIIKYLREAGVIVEEK